MPVAVPVQPQLVAQAPKLGATDVHYGDFRDELFANGYAVVNNVVDAVKAASYASRAHDYLESFGLGYDRNDPETWRLEKLPFNSRGGLYSQYGVGHEQFLWDIRQEPALIEAFARIWGTNELLVSFDGCNISVPLKGNDEKTKEVLLPWAHVDQSPLRQFMHCIQGIVNLIPNGPNDGGLMVLQGSRELYNECFALFAHQMPEGGWSLKDSYHHTPEMLAWFESKGCTWHKVCASPGDLILWDSRTVHYGAAPTAKSPRVASYVCYKPASFATPEQIANKQQVFRDMSCASHDPVLFLTRPRVEPVPGDAGWKVKQCPTPPQLSDVGLKLAGMMAY